ncbi:MAG: hypothetical protein CMA12_08445 [Euryarchaeota archaeon]|nr:hypothetical protein [Euryarchaeota archaeon]
MKYIKVITISAGLSGAGLIRDYLLSRKDFISPFLTINEQSEFRFATDPGGLTSLYNGFYKEFSINNSAYVWDQFNIYINNLKKFSYLENGKKKFLYKKNFFREIEKFKKKIVKVTYYGLPQFYRLNFNLKKRIFWKITNKFKSAQESKFFSMVIPVDEKIFITEATKLIQRLIYLNSKSKNKHCVIDQGGNFFRPISSTKFFSNRKVVLITRDPRSIFSSMKTRQSLAYPGHNVDVFIKWYKEVMKQFENIKANKDIIKIKYENFLLNHEKESKRLTKFIGIKNFLSSYDLNSSKKNLFKAKEFLSKKEIKKIKQNLKKYLQWPKGT